MLMDMFCLYLNETISLTKVTELNAVGNCIHSDPNKVSHSVKRSVDVASVVFLSVAESVQKLQTWQPLVVRYDFLILDILLNYYLFMCVSSYCEWHKSKWLPILLSNVCYLSGIRFSP